MTPEEALIRMQALASGDPEIDHPKADAILKDLIREFVPSGAEIVKAYDAIFKWYA